ncbi:MAG: 30S ribosomal protein S9 [bacterium]|nr:30S ribosomal protein S9 [bacterium]
MTTTNEKTKVNKAKKVDKNVKEKNVTSKDSKLKVPSDFCYGTGKRKTAISKVWLFKGTGKIVVNDKEIDHYLKSEVLVKKAKSPLQKLSIEQKYDCVVKSIGGGLVGQAEAIRHGISRALLNLNAEFRSSLKEEGYLTRDPRVKERKKYGRKKARKGYQYRKR